MRPDPTRRTKRAEAPVLGSCGLHASDIDRNEAVEHLRRPDRRSDQPPHPRSLQQQGVRIRAVRHRVTARNVGLLCLAHGAQGLQPREYR